MLLNADEVCACDVATGIGKTAATASHHLKLLREAGLVTGDKRGTWIFYRVVPERSLPSGTHSAPPSSPTQAGAPRPSLSPLVATPLPPGMLVALSDRGPAGVADLFRSERRREPW
jgi:DNA-binding transcriptional ArsR family regulator